MTGIDRRERFRAATLAVLLASFPMTTRADSPFALRDGDRIVFYGDEVTAVEFYNNPLEPRIYTSFVETYAVTRFPKLRFQFVNAGWNGDRVSGGAGGSIDVRLQRDVLAYKPEVITVMLGINDARTTAYDPNRFDAFTTGYELGNHVEMEGFDSKRLEAFTTGYERLIKKIQDAAHAIRVTVLKPLAYQDEAQSASSSDHHNTIIARYSAWLDAIGQRDHLTVVDPNVAISSFVDNIKAANPTSRPQIMSDYVHPTAAGHLLIAESLLKAWHAPALVTAVEIDARDARIVREENTVIRDLRHKNHLSWSQIDNALPFPPEMSDPAVAIVVRSSDLLQALDQETLKVTGLAPAHYDLRIDAEPVGSFSSEQLQTGLNLALLDTPMGRQASRVFALVRERNNVHFGRWKRLEFPLRDISLAHKQEAIEALEALERDLLEEQYAAAQPKPHRYDLFPATNETPNRSSLY